MNEVVCEKCKKNKADFTDNTDCGNGIGYDEYFCHNCKITTVMYYEKVYKKPFTLK